MRKLAYLSSLFVLLQLPVTLHAQDGPAVIPLHTYVLYDDIAEELTFTLFFDEDPVPALRNTDGFRQQMAFQYYLFEDGIDRGQLNSDHIVTGRWIQGIEWENVFYEDLVLVQEVTLNGGLAGWGPHIGWVDYAVELIDEQYVLTTKVPYAMINDDGRLYWELLIVHFGRSVYTAEGFSVDEPPPPPPPPGPPPIDEQILTMIDSVIALELNNGLTNALLTKLEHVLEHLENGNPETALNNLNAFVNQLLAQEGKAISSGNVDALLQAVDLLIETLLSEA